MKILGTDSNLKLFMKNIQNCNYDNKENLVNYLKKIEANPMLNPFSDEETLIMILKKVIEKNESNFEDWLNLAYNLFKLGNYYGVDAKEMSWFYAHFDLMIDFPNFFPKWEKQITSTFYQFENKSLYINILKQILLTKKKYNHTAIACIFSYIINAKKYFDDEVTFYSSVNKFMEKIPENNIQPGYYKKLLTNTIEEDMRSVGLYNEMSVAKIEELATQVTSIAKSCQDLENKEKGIENRLQSLSDSAAVQVKNVVDNCSDGIRKELETGKGDINTLGESYVKNIQVVGNQILNEIKQILGQNPEVKEQLLNPKHVINPILDPNIPFKERYQMAIGSKSKDQLYHYQFDRILKEVLINKALWLVGPSGSGKSYSIEQLAKLLKLDFYNLGFITDETLTIKGYFDAKGQFIYSNFYYPYKNGGICFVDEIDNSESKALIEFNKIIGSSGYLPYLFPNGEVVYPHPEFRLVAAANTWGDGSTFSHNTREKLDRSTVKRFSFIEYNFDENIERTILKDYKEAYEFIVGFRNSLLGRSEDVPTTSDVINLRDYLDTDGAYSTEEILKLIFIQNRRPEELKQVAEGMKKLLTLPNPFLKSLEASPQLTLSNRGNVTCIGR